MVEEPIYSIENRYEYARATSPQSWVIVEASRGPNDPIAICNSSRDAMLIMRALNSQSVGRIKPVSSILTANDSGRISMSDIQVQTRAAQIAASVAGMPAEEALEQLVHELTNPETFANHDRISSS